MTTVAGPNHTIFKGGQGVVVDLDNANYNENAIVYLKKARNMVPATSGGLSGGAVAGGRGFRGASRAPQTCQSAGRHGARMGSRSKARCL